MSCGAKMSKIYLASDFHIGDERSNYPKIKEFLDLVKQNADHLVLVGDTWDLWRNTPKTITTKDPFKSVHDALLDLAKTTNVTIIPGNHDYTLRRKLDLPNIIIRDNFSNNNIFYTHGHRFDLEQRIGLPFCNIIADYFPFIYQLFFKKPSEIVDKEESAISPEIHEIANKFAIDNNYRYVIMGHTHCPIIKDHVVDCGDFIDSLSYIVIDNDIITLHKMDH